MSAGAATLPPGPPGLAVLLDAFGGRTRDPIAYYRELVARFGPVVFLRAGTKTFCLLDDAAGIERVLKDNHENYTKGPGYELFRPFVGDGLLTSEGDAWRRRRKLMQPAFHHEAVARFAVTVTASAEELVERWRPALAAGRPLDVAAEMTRITLAVVGRTLLGGDPSARADEVRAAGAEIQRGVGAPLQSWLRLLDIALPTRRHLSFRLAALLPTASNRRFRAAVRVLDDIVYRLIAERRRAGVVARDLLGLLVQARDDETVDGLTDRQLRDEAMTMFLAGHETAAAGLTWAFYLLDRHPDVQDRLGRELADVLGDRPPTFADLARLPYLERVVSEALRLYPPFWRLSRHARHDDRVGGYRIPAGCVVLLSPWLTHRNSAYWPDPERFDPDRFLPDRAAGRPRFAYFPFGGGPRVCIGNAFALMEARLILATVLRHYRLRLTAGHVVEVEPRVTLRPRGGLPMTVQKAAP